MLPVGVGGFYYLDHNMATDQFQAQRAFDDITPDSRRAYCQRDLELNDILVFDLTERQRHMLDVLLERWGEENGVEG